MTAQLDLVEAQICGHFLHVSWLTDGVKSFTKPHLSRHLSPDRPHIGLVAKLLDLAEYVGQRT